MALSFPSSPTNGQEYQDDNLQVWVWHSDVGGGVGAWRKKQADMSRVFRVTKRHAITADLQSITCDEHVDQTIFITGSASIPLTRFTVVLPASPSDGQMVCIKAYRDVPVRIQYPSGGTNSYTIYQNDLVAYQYSAVNGWSVL